MGMTINCDMGEGFGLYRLGNDAALMPHIHLANVACGFHASDPSIMHETVRLAKAHGVKVGAHPSLPDMQGFGRRAMVIAPDELEDLVIAYSACRFSAWRSPRTKRLTEKRASR
jgi:5-oxoprolinase (ATP-hydrolysing) subunit A